MESIAYEDAVARYTMDELKQILSHIDRSAYPERLEIVLRELEVRKKGGLLLTTSAKEQFFAHNVPWRVGLKTWWCFFWRLIFAYILVVRPLVSIFSKLGQILNTDPAVMMVVVNILLYLPILPLSVFAMRQALAKHYSDFDLFIRNREKI